jgi:hypothetical protein
MSDEYPDPELTWTCPECGGRIEHPFAEYDRLADMMQCNRRDCGARWKPRNVTISLSSAIDILATAIDRTR